MTHRAKLYAFCGRTALTLAICAILTALGHAQGLDGGDARIRWGSLAITPAISIANVGTDSNVFNQAENPRSDFTATFEPSAQVWLRAGPARLRATTRLEAIGYRRYSDQSTLSHGHTARIEVPLARIQPYFALSYLHLRDRPVVEIDARVLRMERVLDGGLLIRVSPRALLRVSDQRTDVSFGGDGDLVSLALRRALNRSAELRTAGLAYDLTPLTAFTFDVQQERTGFEFVPGRDGTGIRIVPGFSFKPTALISGSVRVGMLGYHPADPFIPEYTGVIAAADVRTVIAGDNLVTAMVNRDLSYSVDGQTYYLQTTISGSLTRQLTHRWDIGGTVSKLWLHYSGSRAGVPPSAASPPPLDLALAAPGLFAARPDMSYGVSVGLGFRLSRNTRISFATLYTQRDSALPTARYNNLRTLGTITYALH